MALLIAMVMVIGMSVSVFAANHTVSTDSTTHTYQIYQIFTGTKSGNQLTNLKYGQNSPNYVAGSITAVSQGDMTTLAEIAGKSYTNDQEKIDDLEDFVNLESTPIAEIGKGKESSASLAEGYYIIKDTDESLEHPETYTLYLYKVLDGDLTIEPKSGTVESEKKVQDINDSDNTPTRSTTQDSADYDIGDHVPYTLTATLPSDYANYEHYYLQFVDDMSKGLTLDTDSVKIYYGPNDTDGTTITLTAVNGTTYDDGQKYTYTISDLKAVENNYAKALAATNKVTIKYTATLNKDAIVGVTGNPNKYHVVYSNNPNNTGEGKTGETPDDTNIVFTYKTVFTKKDGTGSDASTLTGADFKLEKKVNGSFVDVTTLGSGDNRPYKSTDADGNSATQFTFTGLDDGEYKLTETRTPAGYNSIEPIIFTITATHDILSNDPKLTALSGTDGAQFTMTAVKSGDNYTGELDADIINESGATLPSTGGIGTTIFYVLGAVLVIGAGVILIARRRVNA